MATIHSPPRRSLALGHLVSAYEDVICGELIAGGLDHQFLFEASCSSRERPTAPPTLLCAAHGTGRDLRAQPLVKRQACLQALLERFGCPAVSLSEAFEDGLALLRVAEQRGLEGVVSKRRDAPYSSGECRDWRKVKTTAWRDANRERWRLFERDGATQKSRRSGEARTPA